MHPADHRTPQREGFSFLRSSRYAHLTLQQREQLLAWRSLVEIIESECWPVHLHGQRWYDFRPMVDEREHSPELIDVNCEVLDMALTLQLVARHPSPELQHLVCVLFSPL